MNKKDIVKEFYPYVSEALNNMDNVDLDSLKKTYDTLSNINNYSVEDVINAQKMVKDIISQAVLTFENKLIKNVSFDDILLYAQVSKSIKKTDNKNFFRNTTGVIVDTKNIVGTKSFTTIQNDLFGGKPTIYKKRNKVKKIKDKITLYSTVPYLILKEGEKLYRIATLIPISCQDGNVKSRGLIYGMLPVMYFVSDNRKRDFRIARNNYIDILRSQNENMVKTYEQKFGITVGYDVSIKEIK